jgi:maltose O-acetyltransferase
MKVALVEKDFECASPRSQRNFPVLLAARQHHTKPYAMASTNPAPNKDSSDFPMYITIPDHERIRSIKLPVPATISSPPVTETEKMLSGELYICMDDALVNGRTFARMCMHKLNQSSPLDILLRTQITLDLLGTKGDGVWIEPPFYCDYGANIHVGAGTYFNFNCTILDGAPVTIGPRCFFAPNVSIYTATHPIEPRARSISEYSKPITIGADCWIGGGSIILPGITIGECSVVGAGSIVTKDVPPYTVVAGDHSID